MFTNEQHIVKNAPRNTKNGYSYGGMALASRKDVNQRFTYRQFTLVIGVFVALIIVLTMWASHETPAVSQQNFDSAPTSTAPSIDQIINRAVSINL